MNPVSPIKRDMGLALALVMAGSAAACAGPASSAPSVSQPAAVTDGVYTAQVNGFSLTSPMNVEVTIADGRLADIALGENSETQNVGVLAVEQLIPRILEAEQTAREITREAHEKQAHMEEDLRQEEARLRADYLARAWRNLRAGEEEQP